MGSPPLMAIRCCSKGLGRWGKKPVGGKLVVSSRLRKGRAGVPGALLPAAQQSLIEAGGLLRAKGIHLLGVRLRIFLMRCLRLGLRRWRTRRTKAAAASCI